MKRTKEMSYRAFARARREAEPREARAERIRRHYTKEVALERMDPVVAAERCEGDIAGKNSWEGRGEGK